MRASDADRTMVADLLSAAYADGRLTREEYDLRLGASMDAKTFGDLVPLTTDLVPATTTGRWVGAVSTPAVPIDRTHPSGEFDSTLAIFGGTERRGAWRARRRISNLTLFGGSRLDFREATFESDVCEISVFCMFGGVEIDIPDGVNVRNEIVALFGGTEVSHLAPVQPGAPTIVLRGFVAFGGVDAHGDKRRNPRRSLP